MVSKKLALSASGKLALSELYCLWICFYFRWGCLYSQESSQVSIINPNTKGSESHLLLRGGGWFSHHFWPKIWAARSKCLQCFECLIVLDIWMLFWYISRSQNESNFPDDTHIVLCCCIQRKVNWSVFFPARAFNFLIPPSADVWLFDHIEYKMNVNKAFMIWKTFIL